MRLLPILLIILCTLVLATLPLVEALLLYCCPFLAGYDNQLCLTMWLLGIGGVIATFVALVVND